MEMFDNLSRKELQQLCKDAKLKATGKNSDLIARLVENTDKPLKNEIQEIKTGQSSSDYDSTNKSISIILEKEPTLCASDSQITLLSDSNKVKPEDVKKPL
jgi:hypothetical protein